MNLKPIIIETQRLKLTGYSSQDMTFIFENLNKDEIKKILGHRTDEDFQKEEYKYKNGYSSYNRAFILFLLTEKITNTIIGRCGLHNWNKEHQRAEIGYNISDENYKRKGLMTEAPIAPPKAPVPMASGRVVPSGCNPSVSAPYPAPCTAPCVA